MKNLKDCYSDGTTITAEYLIGWIRDNQSTCWPERSPMPDWFYPRVAEAIAPTVRDIMKRYHRDGDSRPYTEDENRRAIARGITLRIRRIWGRIRLGDLACRRCGGKILGNDFVFDWNGSGPYNLWHEACYTLHQTDPQPLYIHPQRRMNETEIYKRELAERQDMVRAQREARRRGAARTARDGGGPGRA